MDDNQIATSDELPSQEHEDTGFAEEVSSHEDAPKEQENPHEPGSLQAQLEDIYNEAEKKAEAPEAKKEQTVAVDTPVDPVPAAEPKVSKAPASWKTEAKQVFDTLPEAAQAEIMRREEHINTTLAHTANERKLAAAYMNTAGKYEEMYQKRGMNSLQAAEQLFEADRILSSGTKTERAGVIANLIHRFGVTEFGEEFFNEIDSHLINQAKSPMIDPALNQRLAQVEQFTRQQQELIQQQQQFAQQQEQTTINTTIEQFKADPKNEFFEQVRAQMGALLGGGIAKDLQDAYDQACYANPEVRKVILQRDQSNRQRAAAGTASLPNKGPRSGPTPPKAQVKDRHAAIAALFEDAGGRV